MNCPCLSCLRSVVIRGNGQCLTFSSLKKIVVKTKNCMHHALCLVQHKVTGGVQLPPPLDERLLIASIIFCTQSKLTNQCWSSCMHKTEDVKTFSS
mmetsp:Transcript_3486/g.6593  ORF Transcript_3486/g.6593 Transcript_3486/m.6593 type:complete len:96 (+) Transcript_3486:235-522(+)